MWLVDPRILCRQHLLGAHVELHMFIGTIKKKIKVDGYLKNNCLQPRMIYQEHLNLINEMIRRGYKHNSPLYEHECFCISNLTNEQQYWEIDKIKSLQLLLSKCPRCKSTFDELKNLEQM